jgi:photosystem II stability/assembly factor-like uncharacterized protein
MSRKKTGIQILVLTVLGIASAFSQDLIRIDASDYQIALAPSISGYFPHEDNLFLLVSDPSVLDRYQIQYTVLDSDPYSSRYFWVELDRGSGRLSRLPIESRSILWHEDGKGLIRLSFSDRIPETAGKVRFHRLNFLPIPPRTAGFPAPPVPETPWKATDDIQAILDSVSINEMIYTERHITGEEPFDIEGDLDSIMTRFSYSYQIYIAQDYLKYRLEEMGYTVELQPFLITGNQGIRFDSNDPDKGWTAVGEALYRTADGGRTWNRAYTLKSGVYVRALQPVNSLTLYALLENRTLLATRDGGATWQYHPLPGTADFFHTAFITPEEGWICGDNGQIWHTLNGGAVWEEQTTPVRTRLKRLFFLDEKTGWAAGERGTLLWTVDGGRNWSSGETGTALQLNTVFFTSPSKGFAAGFQGLLIRTSDGGKTWQTVQTGISAVLEDMAFASPETGALVGTHGTCLLTEDGGASWRPLSPPAAGNLNRVCWSGGRTLWLAGQSQLLSSPDRGVTWNFPDRDGMDVLVNNIIAAKEGTTYPNQYFLIGAHYDSISGNDSMYKAPGADDNGSGTAAVLEAARVLAGYEFPYTIKFALFCGEEQGLWGSSYYALQAAGAQHEILGVLNMDMIGFDPDGNNLMEIHAGLLTRSQAIGHFMVDNITEFGLDLVPDLKIHGASTRSDHYPFWVAGYGALMVIESTQPGEFNFFYHSRYDLLEKMNPDFFHQNARLVIGSLAVLALGEATTPVILPEEQIPETFVLADPYPNPFNSRVHLRYSLPEETEIRVDVLSLLGRHQKNLIHRTQGAGRYTLVWDGRSEQGTPAASGLYLLRFQAGDQVIHKKVALIR